MEWQPIETAPKGASAIDILVRCEAGLQHIVRDCVWLAPVDMDENGNEYYCYDDADWWSLSDDEECEPDWAVYGDSVAIAWRPGRVLWIVADPA